MKTPSTAATEKARRKYFAQKRARKIEAERDAQRVRQMMAADALEFGEDAEGWSTGGTVDHVPLAPAHMRAPVAAKKLTKEAAEIASGAACARRSTWFETGGRKPTAEGEEPVEEAPGVPARPFGSHGGNNCQQEEPAFEPGFPDQLKTLPPHLLREVLTLSPGTWRKLAKKVSKSMFSAEAADASARNRELLAQAHDDAAAAIAKREKWTVTHTSTQKVVHRWPDTGAEIEEHTANTKIHDGEAIETREETPAERVARVRALARRAGLVAEYFQPIRYRHADEGKRELTTEEKDRLRVGDEIVARLQNQAFLTRRGRRKVVRKGARVMSDEEVKDLAIGELGSQTGDGELALRVDEAPKNAERLPDFLRERLKAPEAVALFVEALLEDRRRYRVERDYYMHRRRAQKARACDWLAGVHKATGQAVDHVGGAPFLERNRCESRFCPNCAKSQASRARRRQEKWFEAAMLHDELDGAQVRFLTLQQEGIPGESLCDARERASKRQKALRKKEGWQKSVAATFITTEATRSTKKRRIAEAKEWLDYVRRENAFALSVAGYLTDDDREQEERAFERLRNARKSEGSWWHVHFHALIKLSPDVTKTIGGREVPYWQQSEVLELWRSTDRRKVLDKAPEDCTAEERSAFVCLRHRKGESSKDYMERVDKRRGGANIQAPKRGLAEVIKYICKPFELFGLSPRDRREFVEVFSRAQVRQAWGEWARSELLRLADGQDPLLPSEIEDAQRAMELAEEGALDVLDEDEELTADLVTHKTAKARRSAGATIVGTQSYYDEDGMLVTRAVRREDIEWTPDPERVTSTRERMQEVHIERLVRATAVREREMEESGELAPRISAIERAWWDTRPGASPPTGDVEEKSQPDQGETQPTSAARVSRVYRMRCLA